MHTEVSDTAEFIEYYAIKALLDSGEMVTGVDSLNYQIDSGLKRDRLQKLRSYTEFNFKSYYISVTKAVLKIFIEARVEKVVCLVTLEGVRYSLSTHMPSARPTTQASPLTTIFLGRK
jgi:dTDP-D-glucose 4,6-dehydratase